MGCRPHIPTHLVRGLGLHRGAGAPGDGGEVLEVLRGEGVDVGEWTEDDEGGRLAWCAGELEGGERG